MAEHLTLSQLKTKLQTRQGVQASPFDILKAVSTLLNDPQQESTGREMLLRALEWRDNFGESAPVLDSLARASGLFPYADPENLDLKESLAYEMHRPANLDKDIVFHRQQAEIYYRLLAGDNVIVSAPTSFGKSRIIDAMIASGRYKNVAVVVPTLALIDETRRRLAAFSQSYKVITHVSQKLAEKNIFVFTAERVVAYDKWPQIDFFVIDEFYKIGALDEDESRTIALNEAFYLLRKNNAQFYLLGPSIKEIPQGLEEAFSCYFLRTEYATVAVDIIRVEGNGKTIERLLSVLRTLTEPTLVYCSSPAKVNKVARAMLEQGLGQDSPSMADASKWIAEHYHPEWIFGKCLTQGIGIHHGRLPRSLSQFVVRAFNEERLRFLVCTSTLIEGVNTKAKNVAIWDNKIGSRTLDFFTFNNIKGRSGRMFQHFVGRVYLFNDPPQETLPFVDFPVFSQGSGTPDALLIQLDDSDLKDSSRERIKRYTDQEVLPFEILQTNHAIAPEQQIALARAIEAESEEMWPKLSWTGFPTYDQLKFACELIWTHLVGGGQSQGIRSGSQLALRTWRLKQKPTRKARIDQELQPGRWAAESPDEAVESVLHFERRWASFELPRLLSALSSIQKAVLERMGYQAGDYSSYVARLESLFRTPVVAALDEYGIPMEIAEKLQGALRSKDDLDVALQALKSLNLQARPLSIFEREVVSDAQAAL